MNYLENYYNNYDEDRRLLFQHGQVEYITTQKYIHECLEKCGGNKIIEIGAGTGRYSLALANEGYDVTSVELIQHNIDIMLKKLTGREKISVNRGNALDLSVFPDGSCDITLLLGPMYHLFNNNDKIKALSEALRVTKKGGYVLVSYCMNEPTVIQYVFKGNMYREVSEKGMLTKDWHCKSEPKDLFSMVRTEEIDGFDSAAGAKRVKLVAADGATNYMRETVDAMDKDTFFKWVEYHLSICERQDLIGASHHTLDILIKEENDV